MSDKLVYCTKNDQHSDTKNIFTVEEEDTPDSNSESVCSVPDIVKEFIIKAEKKSDKLNGGKCSIKTSLNEMPNFTKLVTLRYDSVL